MPHEDERNGLQIDGWFQEPRPQTPPTPSTALLPYRPRLPVSPAGEASAKARRVLLACGAAVVVGVSGVMALLVTTDDEIPGRSTEQLAFPSFEPLTPISLLPAPASSAAAPPVVIAPTTRAVADHTTRKPSPTPSRTTAAPPAPVQLVAGATVGLEINGQAGVRLRHRNFVARADRVGASSSALDRADSSFVVRDGLTGGGCVSLESVNYPGYFLRHQNFVLRLEQRDRRENPQLFGRDATFCQRTAQGAVFLESINYPGRSLHLREDGIFHLDEGTGTAFTVRKALA
jgi:alpha-L-arabinofuranosidase B-like protein